MLLISKRFKQQLPNWRQQIFYPMVSYTLMWEKYSWSYKDSLSVILVWWRSKTKSNGTWFLPKMIRQKRQNNQSADNHCNKTLVAWTTKQETDQPTEYKNNTKPRAYIPTIERLKNDLWIEGIWVQPKRWIVWPKRLFTWPKQFVTLMAR